MQLDYTTVEVGTVEIRTQILGVPLPPYEAPELTGDELLDEMLELVAYREYRYKATSEVYAELMRKQTIQDIRAQTGIDIVAKLEVELAKAIDEELLKHAKKLFEL